MSKAVTKKSVLITGTSAGGIGSEFAFQFQKHGYHVFATVRNTKKLDPKLLELPNVEALQLDVVSTESIKAAVKAVEARTGGKLDILVNNSGLGYTMPLLDVDIKEARHTFDVNFWAVLEVTQNFASMLVKAKGTIVNIGSIAGDAYIPLQGIYNASKAAVNLYSENLRLEMKPLGVNVVTGVVGAVRTNFFENLAIVDLPEGSYYRPINNAFVKMQTGEAVDVKNAMPASTFAEKFVGDVVGGAKGKVWRGSSSTGMRWGSWLAPTWLLDFMLSRLGGVDKLSY